MQPHRGTLIVILGVSGILVISLCAPFAWFMGHKDLKLIRAGKMDSEGQAMTKTGMILGMIGVAFFVAQLIAVVILYILFKDQILEYYELMKNAYLNSK